MIKSIKKYYRKIKNKHYSHKRKKLFKGIKKEDNNEEGLKILAEIIESIESSGKKNN